MARLKSAALAPADHEPVASFDSDPARFGAQFDGPVEVGHSVVMVAQQPVDLHPDWK
jgi:hypothetical protein